MVNKMGKVEVTQIRSTINRPKRQKLTIKALGLGKLHKTVAHEATPQIMGMIKKVSHLVTVTEH
jgi:large subunit ribosomal protein L30